MGGTLYSTVLSRACALDRKYTTSQTCQVEAYPSFRAELYARGPKPGGFECARDEEAANVLFLQLATLGVVVWVDREEGDTALGRSI